jgi:hypothetical protein
MLIDPAEDNPSRDLCLPADQVATRPGSGPVRIGSRVLFHQEELLRWLDRKRDGSFISTAVARSTSSASPTTVDATPSPRAKEILEQLRLRQRAPTPRLSPVSGPPLLKPSSSSDSGKVAAPAALPFVEVAALWLADIEPTLLARTFRIYQATYVGAHFDPFLVTVESGRTSIRFW